MTNAERILGICCSVMDTDISVPKRTNDMVFKRAIYYQICRDLFPIMPYQHIGKFVNRDHCTVLYGIKLMEEIRENGKYLTMYNDCLAKCRKVLNKEDEDETLKQENFRLRAENFELKQKIESIQTIISK